MSERKRLMSHVREYLATHGGRREADKPDPSQPIVLVHAYVNELELVQTGIESHTLVMQRMRATAMGALDGLQARTEAERNPVLEWYIDAARIYIARLELAQAGEGAGEQDIKQAQSWYQRMREIV
jgi:hypothetical protein